MSGRIRITEVGPRDGLQNERTPIPTADKVRFIDMLSRTGVDEIEVSSFVPAKWVPQLGDADAVFAAIARAPSIVYSALVPNERGLDGAIAAGAGKVAVFAAASEGFSQRNTNGTIDEVLARIAPVVTRARAAGLPVRGYVSCVIRCPFDGDVAPQHVARVCARLLELGCDEIDLGDTIGAATVASIERLYDGLRGTVGPGDTTLHLHDTHGSAVECALAAARLGVRSFDASAGGLGGCPYAPGAPGNVATEALVEALHAGGYSTGVDAGRVRQAGAWMRERLACGNNAREPAQ
ncbi:MAG: hydroxymethylglutaryl-CoA lyase [Phycisphaerales bacterium]|nr:hydroxymethylglutaryl-CoA lyase [Phycisphaerales bacterium]